MKKIKFIWLLLITVLLIIPSCVDEDKDKLGGLLKIAAFPRFATENPPATVGVASTADIVYSFDIIDGNGNLASYQLDMYAILSGSQTATVNVDLATSFPVSYTLTSADFANLLGIAVEDIGFGDSFFFTATATTVDGLVYNGSERLDFDNLGDDDPSTNIFEGGGISDDLLDEAGYLQAFEFDFIILCPDPFTAEDIIGNWQITVDPFETFLDDGVFEIIAGPGENQVTMLDPFGHTNPDTGGTYNVIIDFNPATGEATVDRQPAWHCNNFGCGFGEGRINGGGFIFECVDLMKFNFQHTVDAGSFGTFAMDMIKL